MLINFFQEHRCVFLRNYIASIKIGVHQHEKLATQRVRININAYIPIKLSTPKDDQLDEVFDYEKLVQAVQQQCQSEHVQLQETLCDNLANTLLTDQRLSAVNIRCEKLDIYPHCESLGVEIFRSRPLKN